MIETIGVEKALLYEQYRLPYPNTLVDDLFRHVGDADVAADIGAGTGQLARLFAPSCAEIYAVEPDPSMRQVASEALQNVANIHIVAGCAEHTTLAENSIDLLLIGNAFHRFKTEAIAELLRILKLSGWAAVVSYRFTNQAFLDRLFGKLGQLKGMTARSNKNWHKLPVQNLFGDNPTHTLHYAQFFTEDWEALWGSARSGIEAPEPHEADFAQFKAINQEVFDTFCVDSRIRIDYETTVLFGQPKG